MYTLQLYQGIECCELFRYKTYEAMHGDIQKGNTVRNRETCRYYNQLDTEIKNNIESA